MKGKRSMEGTAMFVCSCDLDLELMTFLYELDMTIVKVYVRIKNKQSTSRPSKVIVLQKDAYD